MGCICDKADVEIADREFKIIRQFAKGGFSQLFLVEELSTKKRWAMKRLDCHSDSDFRRVCREIEMHRRFGNHPNILALEASTKCKTAYGHQFDLIFEYFKKGSLQDELLRRRPNMDYLSESRVIQIFSQIANAVSVLHSSNPSIAHRDLKPGNVLFSSDDRPILMDFGSCCECPIYIKDYKESRIQLDEAGELCSMPYRAPELFSCEIGSCIDCSIDIWAHNYIFSLGCMLYALCFFRSMFDDIYERGDSIALAVQSPNIIIPKGQP
uniref:non-specific serine/threonine protein kinase n=1 Tax=Syphacia muris TaxID=451379 RepID=A0A0N5A8U9_9BILA